MTRNQQIAVVVGASVVLIMLIIPPFHVQIRNVTFNMGYAFILDPPKRGYVTASVNVGMLLIQWVGTLLLTALAFFALKPSETTGENSVAAPNTSPAETIKHEIPVDQSKCFLGGQHHPWRRFFARTVDLFTLGLFVDFLFFFSVAYFFPEHYDIFVAFLGNYILAGLLLYSLWLPIEALFITLFRSTPAKWVFGISVSNADGTKLSYKTSLQRAGLVLVQGEGFAIPLVTIFTRIFAYRRLTKTGTTLWDTSVGSIVTHKKWGILRAVSSVFIVLFAITIVGVFQSL